MQNIKDLFSLEKLKVKILIKKITPQLRGAFCYPKNLLIAIVKGGDNGYLLESNICNIPYTEGL